MRLGGPQTRTRAFSLVELVLSIGVAAFAFVALIGMMPIGLQANKSAREGFAAMETLRIVMLDRQSSPAEAASEQYKIPAAFNSGKPLTAEAKGTLFLKEGGEPAPNAEAATYRCEYRLVPPPAGSATKGVWAHFRLQWPATAPANASSNLEAVVPLSLLD